MRHSQRKLAFGMVAVGALVATVSVSPDVEACGGCFHGERENTQVVGHRMAFSVSQTETTLWDQIEYSGDPSEFAWVLPIKGTVEVGLSSDLLFETLQSLTTVRVLPPSMGCPPTPACWTTTSTSTSTSVSSSTSTGVGVLAQETVGPYETVQLETTDPDALTDWLATNGFALDPSLEPMLNAYVNEGFNFLALKLAPGQGVDAMRPVRISTPGASLSLPLRMVAAGSGQSLPIRLWVIAEGRYEAQNFPNFEIDQNDLVWDFATSSSNYSEVVQEGYDAFNGAAWLTTASVHVFAESVSAQLIQGVSLDPAGSGYGDAMGNGVQDEVEADLEKLLGSLTHQFRITRLDAELPRAALGDDLALTAAFSIGEVIPSFVPPNVVNTTCPEYPPCEGTSTSVFPFPIGDDAATAGDEDDGGCSVGHTGGTPTAIVVLGIGAALALSRRRKRQRL